MLLLRSKKYHPGRSIGIGRATHSRFSLRDEAQPNRFDRRLRPVAHLEFLVDVCEVVLYRFLADEETIRQTFGRRDPLSQHCEQLALTGGEGEDVFVFDEPGEGIYTGADTITDFVLGQDLIEIAAQVNDTDISSDNDVLQRLSPDGAGGTLIDLGGGNSIHLIGIDPTSLGADDFFIG